MAGADHILGTIGPLSTSLAGVSLFVRTVLKARPWRWEPSLVPIPWRDEVQLGGDGEGSGEGGEGGGGGGKASKLRVGVIWDDGVVRPHPPVAAALSKVVEELRGSDEVEVVDWQCYRHDLAWEIIVRYSLSYPLYPFSRLRSLLSDFNTCVNTKSKTH